MSFARGKQKYTREEIIEILKRNTSLFKDDEVFTQYIIDLASFLIEYKIMMERSRTPAPPVESSSDSRKWLSRTADRTKELGDLLKKHASHVDPHATCKMCGGPTGGNVMCPNCGGMAF